MYQFNRQRTRRQLESDLQTREALSQLRSLCELFPEISEFNSWRDIIETLLDLTVERHTKDRILAALISGLQHPNLPICASVLLVAFWPALSAIAHRRVGWNNEDDELWHILECAFLETISRVDIARDAGDIAGRIARTTAEQVRRTCRREEAYLHRKGASSNQSEAASPLEGIEDPHELCEDSKIGFALAKRRIARAYGSGFLTRDDVQLLLEVDYKGASLEEAALRRCQTYECVKKRRQRILARLRSNSQNNRLRFPESMSPKRGDDGLSR